MNIFSAIIDSIVGFVQRNPLTTTILIMLMVFAPSALGAIVIGIGVALLVLLLIPIFMLYRLRRAGRKMEEQMRGQARQGGFYTHHEQQQQQQDTGRVRVYTTTEQPRKRINDDVGDYVDFEEVKQPKK
jgi:uncharacterized membrane protein YgaE (UPF0421/DUF939 family)